MGEKHHFAKYVHFDPCTEIEYPVNGQLKFILIQIGRKKTLESVSYCLLFLCQIILECRHLFVALCIYI